MPDKSVKHVVAQAVRQAFDDWAAEHPSLALVIDAIRLTKQTAETISESQAYRDALAAYESSRDEQALLDQLVSMAGPLLRRIIGL